MLLYFDDVMVLLEERDDVKTFFRIDEKACLEKCRLELDENAFLCKDSVSILREICPPAWPEFCASSSEKTVLRNMFRSVLCIEFLNSHQKNCFVNNSCLQF
jgi:hypothetical protein